MVANMGNRLSNIDNEGNLELSKNKIPGKVLIFNHKRFCNKFLVPRTGTERDVQLIKNTFQSLKFEIEICDDYTLERIQKTVKKYCTKTSYRDCGSLIIFVLTHGEANGYLWSRDYIYHLSTLWVPMTNCDRLKHIPKLFFIQACRNTELQNRNAQLEYRFPNISSDAYSSSGYSLYPHARNFFFAFSTIEGKISWRLTDKGTWFIQELCDGIRLTGLRKVDLLSLMTKVTRNVSEMQNPDMPIVGQTPVFASFLDYKIYYRKSLEALERNPQYNVPENAPGKMFIFYDDDHQMDALRLSQHFIDINYLVYPMFLTNRQTLLANLQEIASTIRDTSSIFILFLTKLSVDNLIYFNVNFEECKKQFLASNCPSMQGKPKVLMFLDTKDEQGLSQDATGSNVQSFSNDHSDILQVMIHEKGSYEILRIMLQVLRYKRDNILNVLTKVLQGARKSSRDNLSYFESTFGSALYLGPSRIIIHEVLKILNNLKKSAEEMKNNGNHEWAEILLDEIHKEKDRIMNTEEVISIKTKITTANNLYDKKNYNEALIMYLNCLKDQIPILGNDHEYTFETIQNIAHLLDQLGRNKEALKYYKDCLEIKRHILGNNNEHTLIDMHNLAIKLEHTEEAINIFKECLDGRCEYLGYEHEDTLNTLQVMTTALNEMGRYEEAVKLIQDYQDKKNSMVQNDEQPLSVMSNNDSMRLEEESRRKYLESKYSETLPTTSVIVAATAVVVAVICEAVKAR